ncbi:MAG: 3-dehydroquinate synthase [Ruminococcus sp.]|jgi:3-dehydroquinate synthase|nr:3-dehydroquinate synthase [Ruminococcus sp.]
MTTIHAETSKPYDVHIGHGLIDRITEFIPKKYDKFAVITDDNVAAFYLERVKAALPGKVQGFIFPHGEASKTLETVSRIYGFLSENQFSRKDCIVALGGGVVGDITGFAAATYLRGVDFLQIPTSLLAQVDSSVGGKTGVDLPSGKNLVGAFHQPKAVIIDIDTLETLPLDYFKDGLGEVIKYGLISSKEITSLLLKNDIDSIKSDIFEIVCRCIEIKRDIVEEDEFEHGVRKILNFGHTFGHAIERLENFTGMSHGIAVVAGMKIISKLMHNEETLDILDRISEKYGLTREVNFTESELAEAAMTDKKRNADSIDIIVCEEPGKATVKNISLKELRKLCE